MSSKALALLVQGFSLLGDGLKQLAVDLQEGADKAAFTVPDSLVTSSAKPEEKKLEPKKEAVKETKTEAAPEIDEAKLRDECTALVKAKVTVPGKKAEILEALKKVGAAKVTDCPAAKLPELKTALEAIKVS